MNEVLRLKGVFEQRKNKGGYGKPVLPPGAVVNNKHIFQCRDRLEEIFGYWRRRRELIDGALVDVLYCEVIAKSNRLKKLFTQDSKKQDSDSVVGARFSGDGKKHIITHFVSLDDLSVAIERLNGVGEILEMYFGGRISSGEFESLDTLEIDYASSGLSKTGFAQLVVDMNKVESFSIPDNLSNIEIQGQTLVSFYDVGLSVDDIAEKIGLKYSYRKVDQFTALFDYSDIVKIRQGAPNLVAMHLKNLDEVTCETMTQDMQGQISIPSPSNEPVVGVIDTRFDGRAYFSEWVEYQDLIDEALPVDTDDYKHGTAVSSIIVDGASFNPDLDDGCGRFRVRHFAVGKHDAIDIFHVMSCIEKIVAENKDIKVWNLSLGANTEIQCNSISPVAALLDKIQFEEDVIFVVAGTNKPDRENLPEHMRVGSPADSINSLVVNAVARNGKPASYSREGRVLSFFNKPDVCYYGGDEKTGDDFIRTCTNTGEYKTQGASFAAPWVTRKVAYLMCVLGMSREEAKALLVDAACGWKGVGDDDDLARLKGFGIVPKNIREIVESPSDEIRFIISGISEEYDTYNYNIPVPMDNNEFPYIARATLCYFPCCERRQGVDYTNTELDVYFGRIDNTGKIHSINENYQSIERGNTPAYITENAARRLYRKWDNTKHICQRMKRRMRARKSYDNPLWGVSIKTKERLSAKYGAGLHFGLVVTLKEINGVNRIEDFIRQCQLRGWLVHKVNVENQVDIYNQMQDDLIIE